MDNTTYEFFIRRCWDCDRYKHGADTDIWEDLLTTHYNFKHSNVGNFNFNLKEFDKKFAKVKAHLDKAYNKIIATATKKKINTEVIAQLLESRATVAASAEPKEIFDILKTAFPLLNAHNL